MVDAIFPCGALSFINGNEIELKAFVGDLEGTKSVRGEIKGKKEDYIKIAKELAKRGNIRVVIFGCIHNRGGTG